MREHKEIILKNIGIEPIPGYADLLSSILNEHNVKLDFADGSHSLVLSEQSKLENLFKQVRHWVRVVPGCDARGLLLLEKDLHSMEV